ncbi:hypothetical protein [Methylorubrum thiocyanatum]
MTHRSLRLCAVLGALGIAATLYAAFLVGVSLKQAASRGDLIALSWSPAR